ncbi:glycoside hydrolase family 3 protein, partial [uncultured Muribaculum sp.]
MSASASTSQTTVARAFDGDNTTAWNLDAKALKQPQWLMLTLADPGDVQSLTISQKGATPEQLKRALDIFVTYDPMNLGEPVEFTATADKSTGNTVLAFPAKYGAHVRLAIKPGAITKPLSLSELAVEIVKTDNNVDEKGVDRSYLDTTLPIDRRIEIVLAQMTPQEKMELVREGWGIPGVPRLGIPDIKKVEAIHGYSYGTGATMFPQVLAMAASWNAPLMYRVTEAIGQESLEAGSIAAWSPVLDVATDPRWGRCEESFGEDPYLCSEMGKAWVNGYQSKGLITTSKHFGAHGAPLGGRDSHDVGFNEREMREVHLVPFRNVFRECRPQSVMMSYGDYMGVPVGKSKELLRGILRDEWGFDGFIVSDCGAIANMTSRKHYTAVDKVQAANDALRAGIATNCGDTYNDKAVIAAAVDGTLDMQALDDVCRDMLRMMFRQGLFEHNPSKPLNWDKQFPSWQSPGHVALARDMSRQSIVLLKNDDNLLPLSKSVKTIAVIGPGADNLQLGDYSGKTLPGQLKSVLDGIKGAVSPSTKVIHAQGCSFTTDDA